MRFYQNILARWLLMFIAIAGLLAACSSDHDKEHGTVRMIYSPNGEPLNGGPLGHPECKDTMAAWFTRVDTDHDGNVSRDEFMSNARVQFPRMDIDHNGYLLSEELERFRKPYRDYATETKGSQKDGGGKMDSKENLHRRHREKSEDSDSSSSHSHDGSSGIQADPVMSADTNNDFQVTPAEYTAQAQKIFNQADADHNGLLNQEKIEGFCKQVR